jgi:hypothetical protein
MPPFSDASIKQLYENSTRMTARFSPDNGIVSSPKTTDDGRTSTTWQNLHDHSRRRRWSERTER